MPIVNQTYPKFTDKEKQSISYQYYKIVFMSDKKIKYRYKKVIEKILKHCGLKIDDSTGRISIINTFNSISYNDKILLLNQIKESSFSIYYDKTIAIMIDIYQFHPVLTKYYYYYYHSQYHFIQVFLK